MSKNSLINSLIKLTHCSDVRCSAKRQVLVAHSRSEAASVDNPHDGSHLGPATGQTTALLLQQRRSHTRHTVAICRTESRVAKVVDWPRLNILYIYYI